MKKNTVLTTLLALTVMAVLATGCGSDKKQAPASTQAPASSQTAAATSQAAEAGSEAEKSAEEKKSLIASAEEMIEVEKVVEEGMVPVTADQLKEGTYEIQAESSSSMFNIEKCELTVKDGAMSALLYMGGTGYRYIYPGTPEQAVDAPESDYIKPVEKDGVHTFTLPVEALDAGVYCAAFSDNKEKWYFRCLAFRADSLPIDAFADGSYNTVESLGLEDGTYSVEVTKSGGTGKATIQSPTTMKVEDGKCTATITWSSDNYDYMLVDGEKYLPISTEEFSVFEIPVAAFDHRLGVVGDTLAMSVPHEVNYTLVFDSSSIKPQ